MLNLLSILLPELFILFMACFILIVALFVKEINKQFIYYVTQATLFIAFIIFMFNGFDKIHTNDFIFSNSFIFDKFSVLLKIIIIFCCIIIFMYTKTFNHLNNIKLGDYYALCLFSILGMCLLLSSGNLLIFYLSIELMTLPLYVLIVMIKDYDTSQEAAFKYFVLGSVASSFLLFGISLIYGTTGCLLFKDLAYYFTNNTIFIDNFFTQCGCFLVIVGLVFKLGVAPFHVWVPDVYKGASVSITLFISTIPKIAIFGIFLKLLQTIFYPFYEMLVPVFIVMVVLSLCIGNLFALVQTNIKRMFAYSSISHIGFVILGLLSYKENVGVSVSLFYLLIYVLTTLGSFSFLLMFCKNMGFELEELKDFSGFGVTQPFMSFILLLLLFSMAGVPPLVGFYTKLLVLTNIVSVGYYYLAVFSVLMTVVGLFYYLRVVKVMFFDTVDASKSYFLKVVGMDKVGVFVVSINGILTLLLGMYPQPLLRLCSFICT